ncbi:MAG: transcriptional regulator [Treponema sp.]|nr:transcriptional regulator [Treponema sp.]
MSGDAAEGGSGSGGPSGRASLADLDLDKIIHERARLMILTYLASSDKAETGFTEIRDALGMSAGNLSVQLRTLEEAGYVQIEKRFVEHKPYTGIGLTVSGQKALADYLGELEVIVASLRSAEAVGGAIPEGATGAAGTAAGAAGDRSAGAAGTVEGRSAGERPAGSRASGDQAKRGR